MGSTVGRIARNLGNRVRENFDEQVQGARNAYDQWRNEPSWWSVTRHQLGLDRKGTTQRVSGNRTAPARRTRVAEGRR